VPFGRARDRPGGQPSPEGTEPSGESGSSAAAEAALPDALTQAGAALRPEDFWEGAGVQEVVAAHADPAQTRLGTASASISRLARAPSGVLIAARHLLASRPVLLITCAIAGICVVVLGASPGSHSASRRSTGTNHADRDTSPLDAALLPLSIPRVRIRPAPAGRQLHSAGTSSNTPAVTGGPASDTTAVADRPSPPAASMSDYQPQTPARQTPEQQNPRSSTPTYSTSAASSGKSGSGSSSGAHFGSSAAPQPSGQTSSAPSQPVRPFGQNGPLGPGSSPDG